jgi:hypothetical protein
MASHSLFAMRRMLHLAASSGTVVVAAAALALASSDTRSDGTIGGSLPPRPTFEPCPEVACKGKEELAALFGESSGRRTRRLVGPAAGGRGGGGGVNSTTTSSSASPARGAAAPMPCPPAREDLGFHAWHLVRRRGVRHERTSHHCTSPHLTALPSFLLSPPPPSSCTPLPPTTRSIPPKRTWPRPATLSRLSPGSTRARTAVLPSRPMLLPCPRTGIERGLLPLDVRAAQQGQRVARQGEVFVHAQVARRAVEDGAARVLGRGGGVFCGRGTDSKGEPRPGCGRGRVKEDRGRPLLLCINPRSWLTCPLRPPPTPS